MKENGCKLDVSYACSFLTRERRQGKCKFFKKSSLKLGEDCYHYKNNYFCNSIAAILDTVKIIK